MMRSIGGITPPQPAEWVAHGDACGSEEGIHSTDMCANHSTPVAMRVMERAGRMTCPVCHRSQRFSDTGLNGFPYGTNIESTAFSYLRANHLTEWMDRLQSLQRNVASDADVEHLRQVLVRRHVNLRNVTMKETRAAIHDNTLHKGARVVDDDDGVDVLAPIAAGGAAGGAEGGAAGGAAGGGVPAARRTVRAAVVQRSVGAKMRTAARPSRAAHAGMWIAEHGKRLLDAAMPITFQLRGDCPPHLPPEQRVRLRWRWGCLQFPWALVKPPEARNFLPYGFTIYKICELEGWSQFFPYVTLPGNPKKRDTHDQTWKRMLEVIRNDPEMIPAEWPYFATSLL
jgi:hypothetical protein